MVQCVHEVYEYDYESPLWQSMASSPSFWCGGALFEEDKKRLPRQTKTDTDVSFLSCGVGSVGLLIGVPVYCIVFSFFSSLRSHRRITLIAVW